VNGVRMPLAAGALLGALAAAGCGLGPGDSIGDVQLTVTRDYGTRALLRRDEPDARESETALRLLDRSADISTRYGGRFVQSVDGLEGRSGSGRSYDWFFYVDGVESPVGGADYPLHDGYRVWWDYRDWTAAMRVPAVVGSFPEPFVHGYEGQRHPVKVACMGAGSGACLESQRRINQAVGSVPRGSGQPVRVVVGTWRRLRSLAPRVTGLIDGGPPASGVFARFEKRSGSWLLQPLDTAGRPVGDASPGALVAATRDGDAAPTWVVTGSGEADVRAAANLLDARDLRDRYAVALRDGHPVPIPIPVP
jgi:uncharacterized protein DUF4430